MSLQVLRRRFTVEQYHRMAEAGIFADGDRVELIEGEIIEMIPIGSRHAAWVDRLNDLLTSAIERRAIVRVQSPIWLGSHSEPQPDLAVLRRRADFYLDAHPQPGDVHLVIEVADTSADFDRTVKIPLYGRMGIPEAWLVDIARMSFARPRRRGIGSLARPAAASGSPWRRFLNWASPSTTSSVDPFRR
jgi:Uma2 family endonuclease